MKTQDATTMIRTYLKTLKLNRMEGALDEELSRAVQEASPSSELLERLLALEVGDLTERRIERRIRESKLPERKLLTDFDFVFQTGVDKRQIMELATLDFARRKQGINHRRQLRLRQEPYRQSALAHRLSKNLPLPLCHCLHDASGIAGKSRR